VLILLASLLLCCGVSAIFAARRPSTPEAVSAPVATTASFDQAAFDRYWQEWSGTSWGGQVTKIEMDSYGMTAHTKLFPKDENRQPALMICGAIFNYWGNVNDVPAVRVLDSADDVLASKRSGDPACSWRR